MNSKQRSLAVVVAVTVLAAGAGWAAGTQIESPATAAARAEAPAASLITAPVERRVLTSDVVMRGDVTSDAAVDVGVTPAGEGRAVLTTAAPAVGTQLSEGDVVGAVAGRPVIALVGALPVYRDLTPGTSGDDVRQLEEALGRLGIDPGSVDGVYDARAQEAVRALYDRVGFEATGPTSDERDQLAGARGGLEAARQAVGAAEAALAAAGDGPTRSTQLQLDAAVNEAQAALAAASVLDPPDPVELQRAADAVAVAEALRTEGLAPTDTSAERQAVSDARAAQAEAQATLAELQQRIGVTLPQSEMVFVSSLPARVDTVHVERGGVVTDKLITVSGGQLQVKATVSAPDRPSIRLGQSVVLEDQGQGLSFTGTIASVADAPAGGGGEEDESSSGGYAVVITPDPLPAGLTEADIRDLNVKVTIAVTSTDGAVLAVPAAAVTAGTGGRSRVERATGAGTTETVKVTTGLSAAGFVEVAPVDGALEEGDQVVVGR